MSSNGTNECEDADMADCDGEKAVTMMDVLKEQEDFEEDANAVLGASDDKNCTYSKGYIKRQAIYACMTCCSEAREDPTKRAGVCLACSLSCHENHDLIELYTKRNFRCDCGNPKFNSHPCQFTQNKNDLNDENIYNQNFSGFYCICHRPYPDPDATTDEEMIQCIVCEDWLHSSHLDAVVPANDQYTEMICKACMDKNEFLHDYSDLAVNKESVDVDKEESVDILNTSLEINETKCNGTNDTEMLEAEDLKSNANIDQSQNDNLNKECVDMEKIKEDTVTEESKDVPTATEPKSANENSNEETTKPNQEEQVSENISENVFPNNDKKEDIESNDTAKSVPVSPNENVSEQDNKIENDEKSKDESKEVKALNQAQNESITEQSNDKGTEEIKPSNETSEVTDPNKQIDEKEEVNEQKEEPNLPDTKDISDSRTQEQLEEDLLLADPEEAVQDNKDDITSSDKIVNENKSEPEQEMDTTEPEDSTKDKVEKLDDKTNIDSETPEEIDTVEKLEDKTNTNGDSEQVSVPKPTEEITEVNESQCVSVPEAKNKVEEEDEKESLSVPEHTKEIADGNNQTVPNEEDMETNTNEESTESQAVHSTDEISKEKIEEKFSKDDELSNKTTETDILKRKISTDATEDSEIKKPKLDVSKCVRPKGVKKIHKGATFWPSNFRLKLCTCNECINMYKDLSVLFLIDPEDTTIAYERLGKERTGGKPASQYEKGMAALSSLGHVQQINALTEYGKMRDKLLEFLKSFKERKVVVKEEDIKAFFAGMKPVREPDGVYFCR